jgi:sporulation protein YlmC with PRC-barrel domain
MLKHTVTVAARAAIFAVVLATPAFSAEQDQQALEKGAVQNTMPGQSTGEANHPNFVQSQHATDWRGSKLIGATVYGPDNASIGNINDVVISNDGKIRAAVIGVGGFLGVGEKNVAVPLDALNITRKPESSSIDKVTVSYSKDDLKNAPTFAFYEPDTSRTTGSNVSDRLQSLNPTGKPKN